MLPLLELTFVQQKKNTEMHLHVEEETKSSFWILFMSVKMHSRKKAREKDGKKRISDVLPLEHAGSKQKINLRDSVSRIRLTSSAVARQSGIRSKQKTCFKVC